MIASFADKATEHLYHGWVSKETRRYPNDIVNTALRKLDMLEGARAINDLRSPPGNQLESLKGSLKGFFSIRVNDQWWIVFRWESQQATEVKLVDYH